MGPVNAETQANIRSTIESYGDLRKAGDVEGFAALFAEGGCVMPPGAPARRSSP